MSPYYSYHHGGPGLLSWAIFALQLLLVLGIVWLLVSALLGPRHHAAEPAPLGPGFRGVGPLTVLEHRYARGEIGRDEYLQIRTDLGGDAGPDREAATGEPPAQ